MTTQSQPPKDLPPGFPLPSVDGAGRSICVDAKVRILSVASCAHGLPIEDQKRLQSYAGQTLKVLDIDRFGFIWFVDYGVWPFNLAFLSRSIKPPV